jgi:hypothetical protein
MTLSVTPVRYTREQLKVIRALQGGAELWVACGAPYLTDLSIKNGPCTIKLHNKCFKALVSKKALKAGRQNDTNGIAKTPYTLTKNGIAIKCQR